MGVTPMPVQGIGRGDLGAYNAEGATVLRRFLGEVPMRDGNAWCQQLMAENEMLGVRILEVRAAYAAQDFEVREGYSAVVPEAEKCLFWAAPQRIDPRVDASHSGISSSGWPSRAWRRRTPASCASTRRHALHPC